MFFSSRCFRWSRSSTTTRNSFWLHVRKHLILTRRVSLSICSLLIKVQTSVATPKHVTKEQAPCSPSPTSWRETLLSRSPSCRGNTDLQEETQPSVTAWLTPSVNDHFWNRWRRHVVTFLLSDGGVLAVGQRTRRAVTQPGDVELITTEVLTLRPGDTRKTQDVTWTSTVASTRKQTSISTISDSLSYMERKRCDDDIFITDIPC